MVVTVIGPRQTFVERRKKRVLGIWVNVGSRTFLECRAISRCCPNRPFEQITGPETLRQHAARPRRQSLFRNELGPDLGDTVRDDPFRAVSSPWKTRQLYSRTNAVTLLMPTVFRAAIPLPAAAPIGNYDVDVKLLAKGELVRRPPRPSRSSRPG